MVVLDTQQVGDTAPSASDIVSYTGDPDCGLGILNKQNTQGFVYSGAPLSCLQTSSPA